MSDNGAPLFQGSFPLPPSFLPPSVSRSTTSLFYSQPDSIIQRSSSISSISLSSSNSSIHSISNPPPSLPPNGPLPPVPGRSRISDHEAALLLQSRRSSRNSTYSNGAHSRPDSVASFASAKSNAASYSGHTETSRTSRSSPKIKPPAVHITAGDTDDTSQAYGGLRIDEQDESPLQLTSFRLALPPSPTDSEHELILPPSLTTQFPTPPPLSPFQDAIWKASGSGASSPLKWSASTSPLSPNPDESLADISMHDLPTADDGAESEWDVPTTKPLTSGARRVSGTAPPPPSSFTAPSPQRPESRSSLRRKARISVNDIDGVSLRTSITSPPPLSPDPSKLPPHSVPTPAPSFPSTSSPDLEIDLHRSLHRELRSARSRSRSHRERLNSHSPIPPVPVTLPRDNENGRASPDIEKLLEKTPRPRRSLSGVRRRAQSSAGTSRQGSIKGVRRRKSERVGSTGDWDEFAVRGRTNSQRRLAHSEVIEAKLRKLERELEGLGSDSESDARQLSFYGDRFGFESYNNDDDESEAVDSDATDSSLDIHTPLPKLMLRHGLLSPNSKLLPASTSIDSFASLATDANPGTETRPGSTMSMLSNASIQTKSGLFKDIRDTTSRRQRHKDEKLLRDGVGLTTGLGWSDSEDEGAPSALTRRISSLNLSRKPSLASLNGQRTRSKSYGNLRASASMSSVSGPSTRSSTFSFGSGPLSRSFSSRALDMDLDQVDEISEFGETMSKKSAPPSTWSGRKLTSNSALKSSSSSTFSLKASASSSKSGDRTPKTTGNRIPRSASEASINSSASDTSPRLGAEDYVALTPSSTSSSLSIPLPVTPRDGSALDASTSRFDLNLDKGLPSLPNPKTGSIRRPTASSSIRKFKVSPSDSNLLPFSSSSSANFPSTPSSSSVSPRPLKQLQLPRQQQQVTSLNIHGQVPVPVPIPNGMGGSSRLRQPSAPSSRSSPVTPTTPGHHAAVDPTRPKSRVGAGMAYRNSASRVRTPAEKTAIASPKF